jgi:beta-galactosidase
MSSVSRREFLGVAAFAAVGLHRAFRPEHPVFAAEDAAYVPPASPRATLNFNLDWRFLREDAVGAEAPAFDDSKWAVVGTPHTFNDVDSFREIISHGGGDRGTYKGLAWYRKHFKLPADLTGRRLFLEFEGMRQAGDIFLNGKQAKATPTTSAGCTSLRRRWTRTRWRDGASCRCVRRATRSAMSRAASGSSASK